MTSHSWIYGQLKPDSVGVDLGVIRRTVLGSKCILCIWDSLAEMVSFQLQSTLNSKTSIKRQVRHFLIPTYSSKWQKGRCIGRQHVFQSPPINQSSTASQLSTRYKDYSTGKELSFEPGQKSEIKNNHNLKIQYSEGRGRGISMSPRPAWCIQGALGQQGCTVRPYL